MFIFAMGVADFDDWLIERIAKCRRRIVPAAKHRFCVHHMHSNFFNANLKDKTLKDYLWHTTKSTTIVDCKHWMQQIWSVSKDVFLWWVEGPPSMNGATHISRCIQNVTSFWNNVCEVFNKTLIGKNDFEHTYIHLDNIHEANSDEARKNELLWRWNLP